MSDKERRLESLMRTHSTWATVSKGLASPREWREGFRAIPFEEPTTLQVVDCVRFRAAFDEEQARINARRLH